MRRPAHIVTAHSFVAGALVIDSSWGPVTGGHARRAQSVHDVLLTCSTVLRRCRRSRVSRVCYCCCVLTVVVC